ncbi:MAG: DUF2071 domain-containing protein [Actinomycetota bacterium]|nr:DUF2071 domain-containing protein [Actinomycetota bacterium]
MRLALDVRDLVAASWPTDPDAVARAVHPRLEPAAIDRRFLVTLLAARCSGGRLGALPLPAFSHLHVATYVRERDEIAAYVVRAAATWPGLAAAFFGAPQRLARLRVVEGYVEGRGLGVALRYRLDGPRDAGELRASELALVETGGLRAFRLRSRPTEWQSAVLLDPPRADILLALGFDVAGDPTLRYARSASLETHLPPRPIPSRSSSRRARR